MKAIVYTEYGGPEVLKLVEHSKPVPRDNEILVKVHATSVSSGVLWVRSGQHPDSRLFTFVLRIMLGLRKPRKTILGFEMSGEIESAGKNVSLFKPGDKIYGTTTGLKQGAYAEYVSLPETWRQGIVALKPKNLSFEEAATVPAGAITALQLCRRAQIKSEYNVLVFGASGSVGSYTVQLAKYFGANVTGVCSTGKLELVKSIGADRVIDYTKVDFTQSDQKYNIVIDAVGKISSSNCKKILAKKGRFVSVKAPTNEKTEYLSYLKELIEAGHINPVIDKCYPLEQLAEAHRYVENGHKKGNVVISVSSKSQSK